MRCGSSAAKNKLANRSQMQGCSAANGPHDLHARAFAVGTLHIDDLIALAHAQVDRLLGQLVQLAHGQYSGIAHVQAPFDQIAQLQQTHTQAVTSRLGAIDIAPNGQVVQDSVGGRGVQARFFADFLERNGVFARCQDINQREHAFNDLHRGDAG